MINEIFRYKNDDYGFYKFIIFTASVSQCSRALRKNVTTFWWRTLDHAMGDFQIGNRHSISFLDMRE